MNTLTNKLQACIDDEHEFKTAKRLHTPGDATTMKRFFSTCVSNMQIFNFCDGHVTTFWHSLGAYICQMPDQTLSRLAKGTLSESQLSIGTIGLG